MTFSSTSRQVVLQELFDESSEPTDDEIEKYAETIGIDIENEPHLLVLARACLLQPLPSQWKPCYDTDQPDVIYYFNFKTGKTQWIHPLEDVHRSLVAKARTVSTSSTDQFDEDSRTTAKEDLRSFEEAVQSDSQPSDMIPKPRLLEPLAPLIPGRNALRKPPASLGPLIMAKPAIPKEPRSDAKKVSFDEFEVKKRPNSSDIRNRRNIGPVEFRHLSKQEIMAPRNQWRDEGYATESSTAPVPPGTQLTLAGGGAAFLKKASGKIENETSNQKSISKEIDAKEKNNEANQEESKNVRLKLEKELRVSFEMPGKSNAADTFSKSETSDLKQIEIDFEDLEIDLHDLKVPKEPMNSEIPSPMLIDNKAGRNFKKSINIVLNGKSDLDASVEDKKSENLIDLTDGDSTLTGDTRGTKPSSSLPDLDDFVNLIKNPTETDILEKIDIKTTTKEASLVAEARNNKQISGDAKEKIAFDDVESEVNIERTKQTLDAAKADKLKALEGDFNNWVKNTEKMFREKEKQSFNNIREKYEDWKKNEENSWIKEMGQRSAEEQQGKLKALRNELLKEEQEAVEALRTSLAAQTRERLMALRTEIEQKEEQELAELSKTLEKNLLERKEELYRKHQEEMARLERHLESMLAEQGLQRQLELEKTREDEAALAAMRAQLKDAFLEQKTILQQEHELALQKLKQQHQVEILQASNTKSLDVSPRDEISKRVSSSDKDDSDPRIYEKLRCEKRLLEDKYKSLKEKYIRLKTEVKSSIEKKSKKKELVVQSASETDKSGSIKATKAVDSPNQRRRLETTEKKLKLKKQLNHLDNVNQNVSEEDNELTNSKNGRGELSPKRMLGAVCGGAESNSGDEDPDQERITASRKRRQLFSKLKAASTSRLNSVHRSQEKNDAFSPVENLRRQLKKLEELEDQFPVTTHTDTYLRYPFTDAPAPQFASSELEFFKHRIHLERDSVRRAKEFLKTQKKSYENRQRELQHRLMDGGLSSRSILEQIHQEERDLTEMEVSVHRTRALLGEKIIRLRHLEHSLRRVTPERRGQGSAPRSVSREDGNLSDLSSHSDSSGFSSTINTSEPVGPRAVLENKRHLQSSMQESSDIIQSLENLNSEIRGIWEVLKQSAGPGAVQLPPPPLAWPAVRTNPTAGISSSRPLSGQIMTQVSSVGHVTTVVDSSLVDRTRSLRDWLKSARRPSNTGEVGIQNQVVL